MITIFTDGAAKGNPGPGGYGVLMRFNGHQKKISEGFRLTTNNRMELLAVIVALESLKNRDIPVTIYSDSKYVVDAINLRWVFGWEKKGYKDKKNPDLWQRFLRIYRQIKSVKFVWVKGHAGIPENELVDQLAVRAAEQPHLPADHGYEQSQSSSGLL
jgi:ribonuclease HI